MVKKTEKKEVLIFTGAGFSKSMSKHFLTTAEMYTEILSQYEPSGVDQVVHKIFKDHGRVPDDFEYLKIKTLNDLTRYPAEVHRPVEQKDLTAEAFMQRIQKTQDGIKELMTPRGSFTLREAYSVGDNCDRYLNFLQVLLDDINKAVYQQLDCRKRELTEAGQECRQFLESIQSKYSITVFSTNYDNFFKRKVYSPEEWSYYLKPDREVVDLSKFLTQAKPFTYIPLKGILEWFRHGGDEIRESSQHADSDLPLTIPLEYVGQPEAEVREFKSLYKHFESKIVSATYLIFIGFSFNGDFYINNLILDNLQPHQKIVMITKGKINRQFLIALTSQGFNRRKQNFRHEIQGFDERSKQLIMRSLDL